MPTPLHSRELTFGSLHYQRRRIASRYFFAPQANRVSYDLSGLALPCLLGTEFARAFARSTQRLPSRAPT